MKQRMKIYILIKPQDYASADAEVFRTRKAAEEAKKEPANEGRANTADYWTIQEQEV